MPAVVQNHEVRFESVRSFYGRREWNRIVTAIDDQRRDPDALERADEVEISEAFPDRLLHPSHYAEWREIARIPWISKITSYTKLERALSVRLRISLPQT